MAAASAISLLPPPLLPGGAGPRSGAEAEGRVAPVSSARLPVPRMDREAVLAPAVQDPSTRVVEPHPRHREEAFIATRQVAQPWWQRQLDPYQSGPADSHP